MQTDFGMFVGRQRTHIAARNNANFSLCGVWRAYVTLLLRLDLDDWGLCTNCKRIYLKRYDDGE